MSTPDTTGAGVSAYESAKQSPTRSGLVAFPMNSRRELTPYTRRELIRKSRALESNCAFMTRLIRKYARHAVGSGIHLRFLSDDTGWNETALRAVERWWNNPLLYSVCGSVDGWEAKRLAAETILLDGEYNAARIKAKGQPMIQPLDVFEIETPLDGLTNRLEWDDGVRVTELERPVEFGVRTLPRAIGSVRDNEWRRIPAESMFHLFRRRRARGHRGLPAAYSGLHNGIDALDLNALITGTAKLHSALAVAVKGTGRRGKRGAFGKIENKDGSTESDANVQALEKIFGGGVVNYLGENGELNLLHSNHPGANVQEFLQVLFHQMSIGFDVPFSVMWDMAKAGGTAARYDSEDAQSAFDQLADLITWRFVRPEVIWYLSTQIQAGALPECKDPEWFTKIVFRGPRKISVDVGRMATAFKTLTRNAGMSIPRWLEEQGLDAYAEMRDNVRFLRAVREMCEADGVPVEWVYEPTPGTVNNVTVHQPEE